MATDSAASKEAESNYYAACSQIILESRIPSLTSSTHHGEDSSMSNVTTSDSKGFLCNLLLREPDPRLRKMSPLCNLRGKPMVIDVLLSHSNGGRIDKRSGAATTSGQPHTSGERKFPSRGQVRLFGDSKSPFVQGAERHVDSSISSSECTILLERWAIQLDTVRSQRSTKHRDGHGGEISNKAAVTQEFTYQKEPVVNTLKYSEQRARNTCRIGAGSQISIDPLDPLEVNKRTVIMLRSLYCTARLLPAYNLFRSACSSRMCSFTLSYRISVSCPPRSEYENMKDMVLHNFTPVESLYGRMCLSVVYRNKIPVAAFETPILACIIPDYAGSLVTNPSQPISKHWHCKGPKERIDVHLMSVPESGQSSPASFYNSSSMNDAAFQCDSLVVRKENNDFIAPHFINDHLFTLLSATIPIKSSGCADAEDVELPCPFAVDDRMSTVNAKSYSKGAGKLSDRKSQNGAIQQPSRTRSGKSLKTSWRKLDRDFCQYLSEEDEINALCTFDSELINPVFGQTEHQPKITMAYALQQLQMYKEIRDSLLNRRQYLSEKDEINVPCTVYLDPINHIVGKTEHHPEMTMAYALVELQVYKEIRDSHLNQCRYLSEKDEINAPCSFDSEFINPVVEKTEHQHKKTMDDALEELQVYKEIRDSLLN